jgi:hypothetical protein
MHVYFTHGDTMTTSRWDGRTSFRVSRFFGAFFLLVHRPTEEGAKNTKKKAAVGILAVCWACLMNRDCQFV